MRCVRRFDPIFLLILALTLLGLGLVRERPFTRFPMVHYLSLQDCSYPDCFLPVVMCRYEQSPEVQRFDVPTRSGSIVGFDVENVAPNTRWLQR